MNTELAYILVTSRRVSQFIFATCADWLWHCVSFSALTVFSHNALYKSTFYLLTFLLLCSGYWHQSSRREASGWSKSSECFMLVGDRKGMWPEFFFTPVTVGKQIGGRSKGGGYRLTWVHLAFAVAGPCVWNSLPSAIRDPSLSPSIFGKLLKTYLFF